MEQAGDTMMENIDIYEVRMIQCVFFKAPEYFGKHIGIIYSWQKMFWDCSK